MALLHATQLFAGNVTSVNPTFTTAYTVPAGNRIILRSIAVRNLSGAAGVTWYVKVNGVVVFTNVLGIGSLSTGSFEWRPWIVATPAQTIQLAVSAAAGIGALVSGSIYTI
jgi:hypothetical protein